MDAVLHQRRIRHDDEHPDAPINLACRYRHAAALELAQELLPRSRRRGQQFAAALLSQAAYHSGAEWISYSRRPSWYSGRGDLSFRNVVGAVDKAASEGLVESVTPKHSALGWQSVFRGTERLLERLGADTLARTAKPLSPKTLDAKCFPSMVFGPPGRRPGWVVPPSAVVVSRGRSGERRGGSRRLRPFAQKVERLNGYLSDTAAWLNVPTTADGFVTFDNGQRVCLWSKFVWASFTGRGRSSWEYGGRLYGPWWQSIPKRARLGFREDGSVAKRRLDGDTVLLLIDGEETVEPDFPCLHPSLLYASLGHELDDDAYGVDGFERGQAKVALNAMVNAQSHESAVRVLADRRRSSASLGLSWDRAKQLVESLLGRHKLIAHLLCRDAGVALQRIDGEMALDICLTLFGEGIPVLPVHDSFVCRSKDAGRVHEVMDDALAKAFAKCQRDGLTLPRRWT